MGSNIAKTAFLITALLAPFVYLAWVWPHLPASIPVHFDSQMKPDRYGSKQELLVMVGVLAAVSLFVYTLLTQLSRIDPKYQKDPSPGPIGKLAVSLVLFLSSISIVVIYSSYMPVSSRVVLVLLGLLFGVIGYFIKDIKPNYFAGVRLPWTLESAENWNKTHQLTGRLWMWAGGGFVVGSHLVTDAYLEVLFLTMIAVIVAVPLVYSFWLFWQEKKK